MVLNQIMNKPVNNDKEAHLFPWQKVAASHDSGEIH